MVVDSLRRQAQPTVIAAGVGFSALLLCFYLPNVLLMRATAAKMAESDNERNPEVVRKLLRANGLGDSWINRLWTAAVAAPALIGFASLLTGLFDHTP
jgi:hypothetical protein